MNEHPLGYQPPTPESSVKPRNRRDRTISPAVTPELRKKDWLRFSPALPWFGFVAFAVLGLFMIGCSASWWLEYRRSANWPRVEALIDRVAPRYSDSPGDNPTPRVACEYHFTFNGNVYHGTRVSLTDQGSYRVDNGNKVWELDELEAHQAKGTAAQCWVNPADPTRSVLFRRIEPRMYWLPLAGLAFMLWSPMFPILYYRQERGR